ncbi:MAG: M20/M25/M40 family metallo-hydrolase [Phycisphaerales bacterium]
MSRNALDHLAMLVAHDTTNPEQTMHPEHPILRYLDAALVSSGFETQITDHDDGCVNLLGIRGRPDLLLNAHIDTVPIGDGWSRDPFELSIEGGKAFGRGACDIKGGAASILAAAERTDAPVGVLFTTDEEGGRGRCINGFIQSAPFTPRAVIVAEPTESEFVLQHRGFVSFEVEFSGTAGHSSGFNGASSSAVHAALRWANTLLDRAATGDLLGERFNIGIVNGGEASNVIASTCVMRCGFRPSVKLGMSYRKVLNAIRKTAESSGAEWTERWVAPPLIETPTTESLLSNWESPRAADVDFWTEAALFGDAGWPAMVLGPGNIAQAHTADEFVQVSQLELATDRYISIIQRGLGHAA